MAKIKALAKKLWAYPVVSKTAKTFLRTFAATFIAGSVGLIALVQSGNFSEVRDALVALVLAASTAAVHAAEHGVKTWLASRKATKLAAGK